MPKKSICLKVPSNLGEAAIATAGKIGLFNKALQIQKVEADYLCIPLTHEPDEHDRVLLRKILSEFELTTHTFPEKKKLGQTLPEILANYLPSNLLSTLPRALDIVGDIAILELPPVLEKHKAAVGEAIMKTHQNVRVVLAKAGAISGTYRLRDFDFIAGEHRTFSLYKEYGCSYHVDVAKAYFSPRLGREHQRVAEMVQKGETVVDLFAGVGPFAVLIAKKVPDVMVYAIDINADAIKLLKKNTRLNRVENRVFPSAGDAREVVKENLSGKADRVIMNLPETAAEFVDVACKAVKPRGGVVHFYGFVKSSETLEALKFLFRTKVEKSGRTVLEFQHAKTVRATAPYEYQAVLDAQIL